jgi:photosystem II stability/assembly factor-like uncharacterized protein
MALRFVLALCVLLAPLVTAHDASANGRPPGSSTIHFRRGQEQEIVVGLTFGLVISRDGGETWHWMCEDAIGYGGEYDPDYEVSTTGAIFATTFTGMKVARDGCTFGMPLDEKFVSTIEQGPDGKMYFGAADTGMNPDSNIYRSDDGGNTWTGSTSPPGIANDWWTSLEVTPSNPNRLYLAGYRIMGGTQKTHLLFRSDDGGQTWQALPTAQFVVRPNSTIEIAGVSSTDPNLV